ncbi:MAG: zinc ribbon domain-containing protein [Methylocella sp.]
MGRALIACQACGWAVVAEIKKERYVYYHCTGYADKCQGNPASCRRKYVREEALEAQFTRTAGAAAVRRRGAGMGARGAGPTNAASTRKRSSGIRPNTSGSMIAFMRCMSTSSTG